MARYHINPKTGKYGVCRAKIKCRFGGNEVHYNSEKEAIAASEKILKEQHATVLKSRNKRESFVSHETFVNANKIKKSSEKALKNLQKSSEVKYVSNFNKYSPQDLDDNSTVDILGD